MSTVGRELDASTPPEEPEFTPDPAETSDDPLADEQRVGSTERGTAGNDALRSLARAARSFLIYDTHNEAIRNFLEAYKRDMDRFLEFGEFELEVRPFELVLDDEVIYVERERSRSLAFRMFRDGVRRLTFQDEVTWPELLRFLEILSIRYTGVRQNEDDIVTLLWKAGFQHIEIVAVEGFVADEEELGDTSNSRRRRRQQASGGVAIEIPSDWDLPIASHDREGIAVIYREIDEERISAMRGELASLNLPDLALTLVKGMLGLVAEPTDPTEVHDISSLIDDVRDFLLSEGQLDRLLELAKLLPSVGSSDPAWLAGQLRRTSDTRALKRIFHSIPKGAERAPEELVELIEISGQNPIAAVLETLQHERSSRARRVARDLLRRYVVGAQGDLEEWLPNLDGELAADLFGAMADAEPTLALGLLPLVIDRTEREIHVELLRFIERPEANKARQAILRALLQSSSVQVRLEAINIVVDGEDREAADILLQRLETHAEDILEDEASRIGEALMRLSPEESTRRMLGWVKPKKLRDAVSGVTESGRIRQWASVAGLGASDDERAEDTIRWFAKRTTDELHAHCMRTLVRRRHRIAGIKPRG